MSWEKVAALGVAGAIAVAVLWTTGSLEAVTVVIGALAALLAGLGDDNGADAGRVKTPAGQNQPAPRLEASG